MEKKLMQFWSGYNNINQQEKYQREYKLKELVKEKKAQVFMWSITGISVCMFLCVYLAFTIF